MSSDKQSANTMPSKTSKPAPPGDHRKRRRNRTTQSCLNCHTSKRMCDRRRPACQRCTTLGLTGLCVYEVDDPSQRDNFLDEKVVLRSRVAELEGVIRELKNKPHPRWAQKSGPGLPRDSQPENFEVAPPVIHIENVEGSENGPMPIDDCQSRPQNESSGPSSLRLTIPNINLSPMSLSPGATSSCESLLSPQDPHFLSAYNLPSPTSSASSSMRSSPMSAHSALPHVMINDPTSMDGGEFNVEHLLSTGSLEPSGFEDGLYGKILDRIMQNDQDRLYECDPRHHAGHTATCGCINDSAAYTYILELSVRLRKAAEALGRVAEHRPDRLDCELFSRIYELDRITSEAIGNSLPPVDRLSLGNSQTGMLCPPPSQVAPATISPQFLGSLQHWENTAPRSASLTSPEEDSFMSWDDPRRREWSQ